MSGIPLGSIFKRGCAGGAQRLELLSESATDHLMSSPETARHEASDGSFVYERSTFVVFCEAFS